MCSLGVVQGRTKERMSLDGQAASIDEFRTGLRMLVATGIVEVRVAIALMSASYVLPSHS